MGIVLADLCLSPAGVPTGRAVQAVAAPPRPFPTEPRIAVIPRPLSLLGRRLATGLLLVLAATLPARALTPEQARRAAADDNESRIAALFELAAEATPEARRFLGRMADDALKLDAQGRVLAVDESGALVDAVSGAAVAGDPATLDDVVTPNRVGAAVQAALAAFDLVAPEAATRRGAALALGADPQPALLPLVRQAAAREADPQALQALNGLKARLELGAPEAATRLAAIALLAESREPAVRALLAARLGGDDGLPAETDPKVRAALAAGIDTIARTLKLGETLGTLFSGISLGSILLLAALGLAITYGLMGVINMAHGELIMVGAYATWAVQNAVRALAPGWFDWYPLLALPVAFASAGAVGILMERLVIRHLYGRPLETLLATWGLSLILMQTVRSLFGAQNVQVENAAWLSGGVDVLANLTLPYNRLAIIVFAGLVVVGVSLLLSRTRLGLDVRAVTQNRRMAGCMGVNTPHIDMWAFGLGSGVAGLAGCALSQVGNVGPDLGQAYIVDSFMVVVLGGVGQLIGTVYAGLGLGLGSKFLEAWQGAVLAKIAVLVFIIAFIQKRPQGLFALKGRVID